MTMDPRGFTLVEVVAALAVFGLVLGVSGLALASLRESPGSDVSRRLLAARDSAIRSGALVTVTVSMTNTVGNHASGPTHVLFLPDGRAIGTGLDALTGAAHGIP